MEAPEIVSPPDVPAARAPPVHRPGGGRRAAILIALAALAAVLFTQRRILSWNDGSRMATIQALVEHGTFAIDDTDYVSIGDKVRIDGRYYSEKLPVLSILGAAVYWPLHRAGVRAGAGGSGYYLVTLFTVGALWVAGLWAFHAALAYTSLRAGHRLLVTAALACGSLHLPWASVLCNQSAAASCLLLGFLFLLRATRDPGSARRRTVEVFWAGNFLALAAACDLPSGAYYAAFVALSLADGKLRRSAWAALVPLLWTLAPTAAIHWAISGDVRPLFMDPAHFDYPGSTVASTGDSMGATPNGAGFAVRHGLTLLFGARGLFWFNPLLLLAVPLLARCARRGGAFRREALFVLVPTAALVAYYLVFTDHLGGYGYGVRWLLPPVPLLHFFLFPLFDPLPRPAARLRPAFWVLLVPATSLALLGLRTPWIGLGTHLRTIAEQLGAS